MVKNPFNIFFLFVQHQTKKSNRSKPKKIQNVLNFFSLHSNLRVNNFEYNNGEKDNI